CHDRYRRIIGQVYLDAERINKRMVAHGWARQFKPYSRNKELAEAEQLAVKHMRGLWAAGIGPNAGPLSELGPASQSDRTPHPNEGRCAASVRSWCSTTRRVSRRGHGRETGTTSLSVPGSSPSSRYQVDALDRAAGTGAAC
ncbi:MAG: thermonuclease family protein, partial [Lentisphaerae bacterium]|nr:thermonuclease family protein [Lentisphaerota bacterium]